MMDDPQIPNPTPGGGPAIPPAGGSPLPDPMPPQGGIPTPPVQEPPPVGGDVVPPVDPGTGGNPPQI